MVLGASRTIGAVAGIGVILAGCTGSRVGALNTQPAPLPASPSGTVTGTPLPAPSSPQVTQSQFPDAPQPITPPTEEVAAVDEAPTEAPPQSSVTEVASAPPVTRDALVGAWRVETAGSSCQMFMALTQWTGGFRAASRGCPGDAANVSAWDVRGQQVVLSDSGGNRVATLFSSGSGRFDGQTTSGRAISLSR
ncbi:MAG: AprI/Inh family metalloprotease inhibitor [Pseudomonadota bacterium]